MFHLNLGLEWTGADASSQWHPVSVAGYYANANLANCRNPTDENERWKPKFCNFKNRDTSKSSVTCGFEGGHVGLARMVSLIVGGLVGFAV
jgi:hypothetical protein